MKISMEPSDDLVVVDGVPCRLWYGQTDSGTPVCVAMHRIVAPAGETPELDDTLEPRDPPRVWQHVTSTQEVPW